MAHHKRRRPKHQRAGCLHCKPWKDERRKQRLSYDEAAHLDDESIRRDRRIDARGRSRDY